MRSRHNAVGVRAVAVSRRSAADQVRLSLGMGICLIGAGAWATDVGRFLAALF